MLPVGYVVNARRIADRRMVLAGYRFADLLTRALCVKQGSPIFRIERTSYSTGSIPVGYEKLYYRGDLVRFVTRLARKR